MIAETRDLPVRYIKSVVTDDQGRYVVPDLPKANYDVWVRGYGLVDSPKVKSEPGKQLNLTAVPAPNEAAAAQYYPAIYWYSMLKIPAAESVRQQGAASAEHDAAPTGSQRHEEQRLRRLPSARPAVDAHHSRSSLGTFKSHEEAWMRRVQSGQAGENMMLGQLDELGGVPFKYLGDWTDRIAKGELPLAKPPRPQGVERNIVVTLRDWMNEKQYLHDLIASDRRNPTVNAYGPLYGQCEHACNDMPILDPVKNMATTFRAAGARPEMPLSLGPGHAGGAQDPAAVGLLGRGEHLGHAGQQPQLDVRPEGPRLAGGDRCARRTTRRSARRARIIRRPRSSRSTAPTAA